MTDDNERGRPIRFVTDTAVAHHSRAAVIVDFEGQKFALPRYEAAEFFRHFATALGCMEGFDADVYTDINGMVRDERKAAPHHD